MDSQRRLSCLPLWLSLKVQTLITPFYSVGHNEMSAHKIRSTTTRNVSKCHQHYFGSVLLFSKPHFFYILVAVSNFCHFYSLSQLIKNFRVQRGLVDSAVDWKTQKTSSGSPAQMICSALEAPPQRRIFNEDEAWKILYCKIEKII